MLKLISFLLMSLLPVSLFVIVALETGGIIPALIKVGISFCVLFVFLSPYIGYGLYKYTMEDENGL